MCIISFFFENIGHKYDFEGDGVVTGRGEGGGGPALRKQTFSTK